MTWLEIGVTVLVLDRVITASEHVLRGARAAYRRLTAPRIGVAVPANFSTHGPIAPGMTPKMSRADAERFYRQHSTNPWIVNDPGKRSS